MTSAECDHLCRTAPLETRIEEWGNWFGDGKPTKFSVTAHVIGSDMLRFNLTREGYWASIHGLKPFWRTRAAAQKALDKAPKTIYPLKTVARRFVLQLLTYAAYSPGAYHYYATVHYHDDHRKIVVETLKTTLSEKEAAKVNKADGYSGHRPGDETVRFPEKDQAIKAAIDFFKKVSVPGDYLAIGSFASGSPQEILEGPATLKKKANAIYKEWEACDGYEGNPVRAEALDEKWEELFSKTKVLARKS